MSPACTPSVRAVALAAALAPALLLTACGSSPEPREAALSTPVPAAELPGAVPVEEPVLPGAEPAVPTPGTTFLPLPEAVTAPPVPAAPVGALATVDWSGGGPAACPGAVPREGGPVFGDLDGDGVDEAAVVLACGGAPEPTSVLVYRGDAAGPVLVGDALPAEERATVHDAQVRDGHLVVTALAHSEPGAEGEPDVAVTSRWVVQAQALQRTDRWTDPAFVLEVDADH